MKEEKVKERVQYWIDTAEHDYQVIGDLFKFKRYPESLFFCHIILEKIIKAYVVEKTKEEAPKIHNLIRLGELASLGLTEDEWSLLGKVNEFNIETRYPDIQLKLYKVATKKYTQDYIGKIKDLYQKLCQPLKPKK